MTSGSESTSAKQSGDHRRLRPLLASDHDCIEGLLQDRQLQHLLLAYPEESGAVDVSKWMARRVPSKEIICFAVADSADAFQGFVQISGWHKKGRFGWLGMALMTDCRSQGIGRWALRQILIYASKSLGLRKILLEVRADNDAAIGLYKSEGFRTVGDLQAHYFDGGMYHDVLVMERMIDGNDA